MDLAADIVNAYRFNRLARKLAAMSGGVAALTTQANAATPQASLQAPAPAPVAQQFQPFKFNADWKNPEAAWKHLGEAKTWYDTNRGAVDAMAAGAANPQAVKLQKAYGIDKSPFEQAPNEFFQNRLGGYKSFADAAPDVAALDNIDPQAALQYQLAASMRFPDDPTAKSTIAELGKSFASDKEYAPVRDRALLWGGRAALSAGGMMDKAKNFVAPDSAIVGGAKDQIRQGVMAAGDKIKKTNEEVTTSIQKNGLLDFIMSDPKVLAVPAGIIAMLFGGKIGAVVGALAVGYGGYNLWNRYSTIKSPEFGEVYKGFLEQGADVLKKTDVETAVTQYTPTLEQRATEQLSNLGEAFTQQGVDARVGQMQQGIRDTLYLTSTGMGRRMFNSAVDNTTSQIAAGYQ